MDIQGISENPDRLARYVQQQAGPPVSTGITNNRQDLVHDAVLWGSLPVVPNKEQLALQIIADWTVPASFTLSHILQHAAMIRDGT